jgi:hypothetical protein
MNTTELLKTTAEKIANNLQDNITEAPTRQDYLFRMDAMDLAINREGDGRYELMDAVIDDVASRWIDTQQNRTELLDILATAVKERMQTWLAAQDECWKKEVEVLY